MFRVVWPQTTGPSLALPPHLTSTHNFVGTVQETPVFNWVLTRCGHTVKNYQGTHHNLCSLVYSHPMESTGAGPRAPKDTRSHGCSSTLHKTVQYSYITHMPPPECIKASLDSLTHAMQNIVPLHCLGNDGKNKVCAISAQTYLSSEYFDPCIRNSWIWRACCSLFQQKVRLPQVTPIILCPPYAKFLERVG